MHPGRISGFSLLLTRGSAVELASNSAVFAFGYGSGRHVELCRLQSRVKRKVLFAIVSAFRFLESGTMVLAGARKPTNRAQLRTTNRRRCTGIWLLDVVRV